MFLDIKLESWLTIIAIVAGPLVAFEVQRRRDNRRERRNRQVEIYRKLMLTLKVPLNPNHVDAINSIPVEFHSKPFLKWWGKEKQVIDAWRTYASHLNNQGDDVARWLEKKFDLLVDLVYVMGQSLGYDLDKAAIRDNTYVPQAYGDVENEQHKIRSGVLEVLNGNRALTVTMLGPVEVEQPLALPEEIEATNARGATQGTR